MRSHISSDARSTHSWRVPRASSEPRIWPVLISEKPSAGCHHGACGQPSTLCVDEDGAALGGRGGLELVAGAAGELLVPGVGLVEDPQRLLGGGGLGAGRAAVGLEPVAEAAVGVAVGGDGVAHGRGVAAAEQALEAAAVEDAALGREELLGVIEIGHALIQPAPS